MIYIEKKGKRIKIKNKNKNIIFILSIQRLKMLKFVS